MLRLVRATAPANSWVFEPDIQILHCFFRNYRHSFGIRLTRLGLKYLIETCGNGWKIEFATPQPVIEITRLERHMRLPYFVETDHMVTWDAEVAALLTLCDGDLRSLNAAYSD